MSAEAVTPHLPSTVTIESEMRKSYLDYAMSVIVSRALPDARDGLKPVHRRILYAMDETGNTHEKAYRKSAKSVGEVMGNYHPHGDQAIYMTLVRLAQDFSMGLTLIGALMIYGTVRLDEMIRWQGENTWGIFVQPLAFVLFFVAATAEMYS